MVTALLIIGFVIGPSAATPSEECRARCAMAPWHDRIPIPAAGLAWVDGEELSGPCDEDHAHKWTPALSNAFLVDAQFGIGSARPWVVNVRLPSKSAGEPDRGFCLDTVTLGWRTMFQYWRTPLPWVADLDSDGVSELLIWDSFPLSENASMAEYGLMVWVYELGADETFNVNWGLSRKMAAELAEAYRVPITEERDFAARIQPTREMAARELDDFAQEGCRVVPRPASEESDESDDPSPDPSPQDADEEP